APQVERLTTALRMECLTAARPGGRFASGYWPFALLSPSHFSVRRRLRLFDAEHAVERIGRLVDERFGPVLVGVEVLECDVAAVAGLVEGVEHGRPVGRSVEQRAERFEGVVGPLLGELLQVDVL